MVTYSPFALGNECPQMKCPFPMMPKKWRSLPKLPLSFLFLFSPRQVAMLLPPPSGLHSTSHSNSDQKVPGQQPRGRRDADDTDLPWVILCVNAVSRIPYFPKVLNSTEWYISSCLIHIYWKLMMISSCFLCLPSGTFS